jgi:DNA-binding MarR family transcriptional regulator
MVREKLNLKEVEILKNLHSQRKSISELAKDIGSSISWTSQCVSHLLSMGFIQRKNNGVTSIIWIPRTTLGNSIITLLHESAILKFERIFDNSGLKILPLLLSPGMKAKELVIRTRLSLRTVQGHLSRWRQMGLVILKKKVYTINPRQPFLMEFLKRYIEQRNLQFLEEHFPTCSLVWQNRDKFFLSSEEPVYDGQVLSAGYTRLMELNFNIISTNYYYLYDIGQSFVSREEAMVQAFLTDPLNPRIKRLVRNALKENNVEKKDLLRWIDEYNLKIQDVIIE